VKAEPKISHEDRDLYAVCVRNFCAWGKQKEHKNYIENMAAGQPIAAQLYWRSVSLPPVSKIEQDNDLMDEVDFELYNAIESADSDKEKMWDRFAGLPLDTKGKHQQDRQGVADEVDETGEIPNSELYSHIGWLGDDISMMANGLSMAYYVFKHGLKIYDAGRHKKAFLFWRQAFKGECGSGLAEALAILHIILYQ
jgi:hypothetical protein